MTIHAEILILQTALDRLKASLIGAPEGLPRRKYDAAIVFAITEIVAELDAGLDTHIELQSAIDKIRIVLKDAK